jgi:hypothetical protein
MQRSVRGALGLLITGLLLLQQVPAGADAQADLSAGRPDPGRRADADAVAALQHAIAAAGGIVFPSPEASAAASPQPIGGWVVPLLSIDLTGDGGDEIVLNQRANRDYLVAANAEGIVWRQKTPEDIYLVGAFDGDLSPEPGRDLVLAIYRPHTIKSALVAFGANGLRWVLELDPWQPINGLVQADSDPADEFALTTVDPATGADTVTIVDGRTGTVQSVIGPTDAFADDFVTRAFVTDGPAGQPDEAVFVTELGFYAGVYRVERVRLDDGSQVATGVVPAVKNLQVYQGPDYTGDDRRDATVDECLLSVVPCEFGVLDPISMSVRWTNAAGIFDRDPDLLGDADGDGGQDPCLIDLPGYVQNPSGNGLTLHCFGGSSGAELWTVTRSVAGNSSWVLHYMDRDLDGDGVVDPMIETRGYNCTEDDTSCSPTTSEIAAFSGRSGAVIWSVDGWTNWGAASQVTTWDLDGLPGDDRINNVWAGEDRASFEVESGLTKSVTWSGSIEVPNGGGYVTGAIEADVNGDGSGETVLTLLAWRMIGQCPACHFEQATLLSAFEPRGQELWRVAV